MHFWCSNLMLHSKSPIIRRKAKRKVQYCKTVKWTKMVWNCIKIGKMSSFQMNPHSKPISFASLFPSGVWNTNKFIHITLMDGKNPLESYWGDYLITFKGVSQLKLANETITSKAYQDNINSDVKLQYECTIPQAFNKIPHHAISL